MHLGSHVQLLAERHRVLYACCPPSSLACSEMVLTWLMGTGQDVTETSRPAFSSPTAIGQAVTTAELPRSAENPSAPSSQLEDISSTALARPGSQAAEHPLASSELSSLASSSRQQIQEASCSASALPELSSLASGSSAALAQPGMQSAQPEHAWLHSNAAFQLHEACLSPSSGSSLQGPQGLTKDLRAPAEPSHQQVMSSCRPVMCCCSTNLQIGSQQAIGWVFRFKS